MKLKKRMKSALISGLISGSATMFVVLVTIVIRRGAQVDQLPHNLDWLTGGVVVLMVTAGFAIESILNLVVLGRRD